MTRFARAKGAAASNERIEEDATPWHVMAQQMRYANGYKSNSNRDVEDLDGGLISASEEKENISIANKHATSIVEQDDSSSSDENDYEIQNGKFALIPLFPSALVFRCTCLPCRKNTLLFFS